MNTTLEAVRAKVIEAVPEIETFYCGACGQEMNGGVCSPQSMGEDATPHEFNDALTQERPITLADVLRAIDIALGKSMGDVFLMYPDGAMMWSEPEVETLRATWNLALPLDEQEPEVIEFLAKILL